MDKELLKKIADKATEFIENQVGCMVYGERKAQEHIIRNSISIFPDVLVCKKCKSPIGKGVYAF